jgi:hypothetical protein
MMLMADYVVADDGNSPIFAFSPFILRCVVNSAYILLSAW